MFYNVVLLIFCVVISYAQVFDNSTKPPNTLQKPSGSDWPGSYNNGENKRTILGDWLLTGSWDNNNNGYKKRKHEYEGFDGFYNNLARPDLGSIDQPLLRRTAASYKDGTYEPSGFDRPNPFVLSDKLLNGTTGTKSKTGKSAFLVFFGQQVVEEILDAQRPACPPEYFNIPIPEGHRYRRGNTGPTAMPLLRTRYDQKTGYSPNNPRQQLNEITPYLDGGLFYGITKQWADQLRTDEKGEIDSDGCLASSHNGLFPAYNTDRLPMANPPPPFYHQMLISSHESLKVNRFFKLGNPRGNENSFLLTFGIMWFRWHNYLAKRLRQFNPSWKSEEIFNEARKWVIATQQKIVVKDWLSNLLGEDKIGPYTGYNPAIDPQIDQFFQSAAFRFGHTLVVPGVYLRDYIRTGCKNRFDTWNKNTVRTCNIFWRPYEPILNKTDDKSDELIDIDRLLMGMAVQLSEAEDHRIVEDLRGNVFGPLEFPRRDLMAINIQRARDHGLPDFNTARAAYGLPNVNFDSFPNVNNLVIEDLKMLYNNSIDKLDIWIGGLMETNEGPGQFFEAVIVDQFRRIRDGDRFWFENTKNDLFTPEEINRINSITIYDIIMAVTKMDAEDIPINPFAVPMSADSTIVKACNLISSECNNVKCFHLPPLTTDVLNETCTDSSYSYDYFSNSEVSYIVTFIFVGTFIIGPLGAVYILLKLRDDKINESRMQKNRQTRITLQNEKKVNYPLFVVQEWIGHKLPLRNVVIVLKKHKSQIAITSPDGVLLRVINFSSSNNKTVEVYEINDSSHLILTCPHNYDLVVRFEGILLRDHFLKELDEFYSGLTIQRQNITTFNLNAGLKKITTKEDRQKILEQFYRVSFAQAFKINYPKENLLTVDDSVEKEIINTELTVYEFAEAMNMRANDEFVMRMFNLIDKDKSGSISFREFVDLLIIFANGNEKEKAKLLFDMYDINAVGYLTRSNFVAMIKSFLACVSGNIDEPNLTKTVDLMLQRGGVIKDEVHFEDFLRMCGDEVKNLSKAKLNFSGVQGRVSYLDTARDTIENIYLNRQEIQERLQGEIQRNERNTSQILDIDQENLIKQGKQKMQKSSFLAYVELNSKKIFWLTLYTLVLLAIFAERAYYYSVEREHSGLRRIAGYGVTITRGAASAMMFTYSSLLVTMCKNTITYLRETVANNYFPFDASIEIHKYIAYCAFIFTVNFFGISFCKLNFVALHIIGHAFNFYHISTQTADDLTCLFRNFFHATHELPKFHYWCWETITGFTGIILTLIWALIYIFAQNIVRKKLYNWFWYTHNLYPLFFIFTILHGSGRLIQPPFFYYFFLGPVILFTIDTLVSAGRKKIEIPVIRAEILPSEVTMLEFRKPENFQYKSGQWIRIACLSLNRNEFHPFTLTSSPNENCLSVHIRAVGPWTSNVRRLYESSIREESPLPRIYLDGPFGEAHQDWNLYDVSILIGGGIGVTPFASILKDIGDRYLQSRCKKVYFIWVSRDQKQFEWLVDIIRELEYKDRRNLVSCHIFITQFFEKFDLRTIFLYICERHYQRVCERSLFTQLKAVTHFGRPRFSEFFQTVADLHETPVIGVFSCGPPSMTSSVNQACSKINITRDQKFVHHYKNF